METIHWNTFAEQLPIDKPTRGLESTCSSFLPRWCPSLGRHASSPRTCLGNSQGGFLPCLLRVFRKSRGSTLPLAATIPVAVEVLFCFFQLLSAIPRLFRGGTFLRICLQLWRKYYRKTSCRKVYKVWIRHWNLYSVNWLKNKKTLIYISKEFQNFLIFFCLHLHFTNFSHIILTCTY